MKTALPLNVISAFAKALKVKYHAAEILTQYKSMDFDEAPTIKAFQMQLTELGKLINISFLENRVEKEHFRAMLSEGVYPVLVFLEEMNQVIPFMIQNYRLGVVEGILIEEETTVSKKFSLRELQTKLYYPVESGSNHEVQEEKMPTPMGEMAHAEYMVYLMLPVVIEPIVANTTTEGADTHIHPWKRLIHLLVSERREIGYIYIYAIMIGLLSLTTPIGVQAVINIISSGMVPETVFFLVLFVVGATFFMGVLQVFQMRIVEALRQRIFAKSAFEFAFRIPRIRMEALSGSYAPELINRFFDVLTIQKGYSKILIEMLTAVLQIFFGLLLMSFYHPFFIFFGLTLVVIVAGIFYFTSAKGLKSSIYESKYKYKVVHWLEEIARTLSTFKLAGYTNMALERTDLEVSHYLKKREDHFKVLMLQYKSIVLFKVVITGGILILGTYLVIGKQITLGQFVASELVILIILAAVEKLILNMDTIYDVLTAVDKVGQVTDLPLESPGGIALADDPNSKGFDIKLTNLKYKYPSTNNYVLKGVNLHIKPGERVGILGPTSSGKTTLVNILTGLYDGYEGIIAINGLSLRDVNVSSLRDEIGDNLSVGDIFEGTVVQNITVGKPSVTMADVIWALDQVGLSDFIQNLPNGIHTHLIAGGKTLPATVVKKLILARSIAEHPRLIVFDEFFMNMPNSFTQSITHFIMDRKQTWTVIAVTMNPIVLSQCDRVILFSEGNIVKEKTFKEAIRDPDYQEFIPFVPVKEFFQ
jgi:ABC-type bacteriocin/lantibiotic exporter with double-glycine peptidase domain